MMQPIATPLPEQLAILILGPPIMAVVIWFMSFGWVTIQGGEFSETTKRRRKIEFCAILAVMYVLGFGMAVYAWFIKPA